MDFLAFYFEVSDKIPSVFEMYIWGVFWAAIVLLITFLNRWAGLIVLICFLSISIFLWTLPISVFFEADIIDVVRSEMGNSYFTHWIISSYFTWFIEVFAFISGLLIKKHFFNRKIKLK